MKCEHKKRFHSDTISVLQSWFFIKNNATSQLQVQKHFNDVVCVSVHCFTSN